MKPDRNRLAEGIAPAQHPDYAEEIAKILRSNLAPKLIQEQLLNYHENDIADAMDLLQKEERYRLYHILDAASLAQVLEYSDALDKFFDEMSVRKKVEILSELEPSTAAEYLKGINKTERDSLIELMSEDAKHEIFLVSSFDENEIGSKMTTNFVSIGSDSTVRQAMRELIKQAANNDNISTIYVADMHGMFAGAIDLKDLIIARENTPLDTIIMTSYPYVYATEQIEDCIERIKDYSEDSIPILDAENRIKGVLTAVEITQLVDDEMGDDYAKFAGLTAEEDLHEPLGKSIGKRLPWLIILLGLGLVVSSAVSIFENVVASLTLIIYFQSLVLDMAGNAGTQSLAVTIRVLIDEEVSRKEKIYLILKEAKIGLCNGLILGAASFVLVGLYLLLLKGESTLLAFSVSMCTGAALMIAMFMSSIIGTVMPLIFRKLKIDPAVASGPFITTINDLVAVVSYYGLSWLLLINVLKL